MARTTSASRHGCTAGSGVLGGSAGSNFLVQTLLLLLHIQVGETEQTHPSPGEGGKTSEEFVTRGRGHQHAQWKWG